MALPCDVTDPTALAAAVYSDPSAATSAFPRRLARRRHIELREHRHATTPSPTGLHCNWLLLIFGSKIWSQIKMPAGRRPKSVKAPTKLERAERLREQIVSLADDLLNDGYGSLLQPP